jgi:hypothetical protein
MSRVMEIVSPDSPEVVAKKVYIAFRRIRGRVYEYDPSLFVEGKVYIGSTPALMTIEWKRHRDGQRMLVDIAASSGDELNRSADVALYRFLDAFKTVTDEDTLRPLTDPRRTAAMIIAGLAVTGVTAAYFLGISPFR